MVSGLLDELNSWIEMKVRPCILFSWVMEKKLYMLKLVFRENGVTHFLKNAATCQEDGSNLDIYSTINDPTRLI